MTLRHTATILLACLEGAIVGAALALATFALLFIGGQVWLAWGFG